MFIDITVTLSRSCPSSPAKLYFCRFAIVVRAIADKILFERRVIGSDAISYEDTYHYFVQDFKMHFTGSGMTTHLILMFFCYVAVCVTASRGLLTVAKIKREPGRYVFRFPLIFAGRRLFVVHSCVTENRLVWLCRYLFA